MTVDTLNSRTLLSLSADALIGTPAKSDKVPYHNIAVQARRKRTPDKRLTYGYGKRRKTHFACRVEGRRIAQLLLLL
jgi:hypothetical protein